MKGDFYGFSSSTSFSSSPVASRAASPPPGGGASPGSSPMLLPAAVNPTRGGKMKEFNFLSSPQCSPPRGAASPPRRRASPARAKSPTREKTTTRAKSPTRAKTTTTKKNQKSSAASTKQTSKPIPALYVVYILRSSVRSSSLYIGSTPDPVRRLRQHNGEARGGAGRTSRDNLRPWEMVVLVTGFGSSGGALKFEWALQNPHLTTHIKPEDRLSKSTSRHRCGRPRRPAKSMISILSNLHLLLRSSSFERWPLRLHVLKETVMVAWRTVCDEADRKVRESLVVEGDYGPPLPGKGRRNVAVVPDSEDDEDDDWEEREEEKWGIQKIPTTYAPLESYVAKAKDIFDFEREGDCIVCGEGMEQGGGIYAVCPNEGCEGVGHLGCWGKQVLRTEEGDLNENASVMMGWGRSDEMVGDEDGVRVGDGGQKMALLPVEGRCPCCRERVVWGTMMKEVTLRLRGKGEVEKLLKKPRAKKAATVKAKGKGKGKEKATTKGGGKGKGKGRDVEDEDKMDEMDDEVQYA